MKPDKVTRPLLSQSAHPGYEADAAERQEFALKKARQEELLKEINVLKKEIARLNRALAEKQKEYRQISLSTAEPQSGNFHGQHAGLPEPGSRWWIRPCAHQAGAQAEGEAKLSAEAE
ncbi:MAG TPA: hypothetical protein VNQ79_08195 [Blastocatellia bacterium]|nr:hypothetical protein [Blastocatellia bacterium]